MFQIITVSKETGLGLNIVGGINRNEGPLVYVLEVIPGGDCHKVDKGGLQILFPLQSNFFSLYLVFAWLLQVFFKIKTDLNQGSGSQW